MRAVSRILQFFSVELIYNLFLVMTAGSMGITWDNAEKVEKIQSLLDEFKVPWLHVASGTNRYCVQIDGYAVKFALDRRGNFDNLTEFAISKELNGLVARSYETNGIILFQELVQPLGTGEFEENKPNIAKTLNRIKPYYLLQDVGMDSKRSNNWGFRDNYDLVILDYGYVYPYSSAYLGCKSPGCDGTLDYNRNFTSLVCNTCKREVDFYTFTRAYVGKNTIERHISDKLNRSSTIDQPLVEYDENEAIEEERRRRKKEKKLAKKKKRQANLMVPPTDEEMDEFYKHMDDFMVNRMNIESQYATDIENGMDTEDASIRRDVDMNILSTSYSPWDVIKYRQDDEERMEEHKLAMKEREERLAIPEVFRPTIGQPVPRKPKPVETDEPESYVMEMTIEDMAKEQGMEVEEYLEKITNEFLGNSIANSKVDDDSSRDTEESTPSTADDESDEDASIENIDEEKIDTVEMPSSETKEISEEEDIAEDVLINQTPNIENTNYSETVYEEESEDNELTVTETVENNDAENNNHEIENEEESEDNELTVTETIDDLRINRDFNGPDDDEDVDDVYPEETLLERITREGRAHFRSTGKTDFIDSTGEGWTYTPEPEDFDYCQEHGILDISGTEKPVYIEDHAEFERRNAIEEGRDIPEGLETVEDIIKMVQEQYREDNKHLLEPPSFDEYMKNRDPEEESDDYDEDDYDDGGFEKFNKRKGGPKWQ